MHSLKVLMIAACASAVAIAATPAAAVNLITNGDFSAGNSGFTSLYVFRSPGQYGNPGLSLAEGLYAIDTNADNTHSAWVNLPDHTGDTAGLYLIANGAGDDIALWQQDVAVTANTTYNFSAFVADVCCNSNASALNGQFPPSFVLRVSDGITSTDVANFGFPLNSAGVWQQFGGSFFNGSATSLSLSIVNLNTVPGGNDLGLDDISLTAVAGVVPEPASWAMLIAGFGLVGAAARRRRRTSVLA
jgi:hypothetical protein